MKIIAEFCQNHNGDFEVLKRMIHAAAAGGATHGKIQTIFAEELSFRPEFEQGEEREGKTTIIKRPYQAEYDRLKKLELTYAQHADFITECNRAGIIPLTTAFTVNAVTNLRELGWKSIKIASYDCGSLPLIKACAQAFDELIISTGASYDEEIAKTADYLNGIKKHFSFLHCVTIYPTPLDQLHLNRMKFLGQYTASVGLSEHTQTSRDGVKACIAAIYAGATLVERHFTVLPPDQSRDGKVSIATEHLREIVAFCRLSPNEQQQYIIEKIPEYPVMLGQKTRPLSHDELLNRAYYRGRFCNKVDGKQVFNWEEHG